MSSLADDGFGRFARPGRSPANSGCMSQNGSHCLSEQGFGYEYIGRFYYGEDIEYVQTEGACIEPPDDTGMMNPGTMDAGIINPNPEVDAGFDPDWEIRNDLPAQGGCSTSSSSRWMNWWLLSLVALSFRRRR